MVLQNLAKYYGRYMRSVFVQRRRQRRESVMVGEPRHLVDSVTDGRMKDLEVPASAVPSMRRAAEGTFYGLQVAQNDKPQVYVVGH